jgi:hypothetical protein
MPVAVPPVQLDHVAKTEIGDEIKDVFRDHDGRCRAAPLFCVLD